MREQRRRANLYRAGHGEVCFVVAETELGEVRNLGLLVIGCEQYGVWWCVMMLRS
jgi:hypothetical protein